MKIKNTWCWASLRVRKRFIIFFTALVLAAASVAAEDTPKTSGSVWDGCGRLGLLRQDARLPDFTKRHVRLECVTDFEKYFLDLILSQLTRLSPAEESWLREEHARVAKIEDVVVWVDQQTKLENTREFALLQAKFLLDKVESEVECIRQRPSQEALCWVGLVDSLSPTLLNVLRQLSGTDDFPCATHFQEQSMLYHELCAEDLQLLEDPLQLINRDIVKFIIKPHLQNVPTMGE